LDRKKRFLFLTWAIIISSLVFGVYFVYGSLQIKRAQSDAENYSAAPFCKQESGCRKVIQTRVLESRTADVSTFISTGKYGLGYKRNEKKSYLVVLMSENLEKYEVAILPNLEMKANSFGVPNVYFPVHHQDDAFDNFAERSFPIGVSLKVETWNGHLTLIYSQYVNSSYAANTLTFLDTSSPSTTSNPEVPEPVTTYAIPTVDNPLVVRDFMQNQFEGSLAVIAIFPILFIALKVSSTKR
jgi:hypothetical protein